MKITNKRKQAIWEELTPSASNSRTAGYKGAGGCYEGKGGAVVWISGWNQYSRGVGHYINKAVLVVRDETGIHEVRIPYSIIEKIERKYNKMTEIDEILEGEKYIGHRKLTEIEKENEINDIIQAARNWVEPAEVRKARESGKKVKRQGDIYFIEAKKNNLKSLERSRHTGIEVEGGIQITHPEHKVLKLKGSWKAVLQKNSVSGKSLD